ncbi:intracellular multiplication protein IcmG [Kosakonia radicincitans]|uniref:Intracellular multiplication protein IcmG n=1 Tax=Kosakonia radicincitans TaxID=283686 RepID=A0AAX2EZI9_9ENTR|nr:conjugal transfer protein TraP [Kosakonia radicincitans]SFF38085.1 intracellular multiplication protein IcmG [Kosakonia radicincitans]SFR26248.1 intracellular multiplication protein IcmG [Kosakonia radicincitans]SFU16748.1 intracellular multiplication protein IcmG [Kosakonia radicincitans]SFY32058.1 intracellular multiplication protein IcmG [Kosakonia radicincitans]
MNEFDPEPVVSAPLAPSAPQTTAKKESILTRPLLLGYSLPWLAGIGLALGVLAWFMFWPASSSQDASQRAFGQDAGLVAVQPPTAAPAASAPAGLQTGGLSVTATMNTAGSVPEDVVALIREGHEFEVANREAITRLSDTVRAQTKALAGLQQQVDGLAKENARLANQLTVLAVRPAAEATGHTAAGRKGVRSALAGMKLESLQDGMAWVSWQGRTWAVEPGDSLGGVTVRDVNAAERSVTTSAGVLR